MSYSFEELSEFVALLILFCTGLWAFFQFVVNYRLNLQSKRIEATKPFLEKQLALYTEATEVAAKLATSQSDDELDAAKKRFLALYWGELALVEDKAVETAMVKFKQALDGNNKGHQLEQLSLALAHACRDSLAMSWKVEEWRNPHYKNLSASNH